MIKKETINLNQKGKTLNEVYFSQFAGKVQQMLLDLYAGGMNVPVSLIGTSKQVESFMTALSKEKRYMDSYMRHGLDKGPTMVSKSQLDTAVSQFEYETGLRWPFKN
tara:strand:+ start:101 stop:421 length:321 start_codon:yes stop_codon:yes gene_type:complete